MKVAVPGAVLVGMVAASAVALAQQGPLVVPIVGSPAAQQQQQQPQPQPPQTTGTSQIPTPMPPPAGTSQNVPPMQTPVNPLMPPMMQPGATPPGMSPGMAGMPQPTGQVPIPDSAVQSERKLQLSFNKGSVSLVAQNVTVREILAEWERKNGCKFVNADRLTGGMVSFEFPQETELRVIASLLRGAAGYIVAPRADTEQTGSVCGSVFILATSRPTATATSYTPTTVSPLAAPLMQPGSPDDEIPPVAPPMGPQNIQPRPGGQQGNGPQPGMPPQQQQPPSGAVNPIFGPVPVTPTAPGRIGGPLGPPTSPLPGSPQQPNGPGRGGGGGN